MKVYYTVNYGAFANPGDANIYKSSEKTDVLHIKIMDILKTSLFQCPGYKKIKNIEQALEQFLLDFAKSSEIQMLYLDGKSKEVKYFEKAVPETEKNKFTYKNIVFLGLNNNAEWSDNAAAIYCDLEIKFEEKENYNNENYGTNIVNKNFTFNFIIKRIEFLDFDRLYNNKKFVNINNIEFIKYDDNLSDKRFNGAAYFDEITNIKKLEKVVNIFDKNTNDPNKFHLWFNFIKCLDDFIKKIDKDNKHYLFNFDGNLNADNLFNNEYYTLLSKATKLRDADLKYLFNGNDENIKYEIKAFLKNNEPNNKEFLKTIKNLCDELTEKNNQNQKNIKILKEDTSLEKELEEQKQELNRLNNEEKQLLEKLQQIDNQIKPIQNKQLNKNEEQNELKKKINFNQEKIKQIKNPKEKNKLDIFENIKELKEEINKWTEQIQFIENELKQYTKNLEPLENEQKSLNKNLETTKNNTKNNEKKIDSLNIKIKEKEKKINDIKEKIKTNEKKIDVLTKFSNDFQRKKYNAYSVKIELSGKEDVDLKEFDPSRPTFNLEEIDNGNSRLHFLSENFTGLSTKIKRYNNALKNAAEGFYKNPYLIYSLKEMPVLKKDLNQISLEIKNKYKLNQKQIITIEKALTTLDTFYLQGPPGTGKTQTICAMTEELIKKNKNILMTSSTHEAISNFLDRLDENNTQDPNLIIFKYTYVDKKSKLQKDVAHSENNLYPKFIERIKNYVLKSNNNDEKTKIASLKKQLNDKTITELKNNLYCSEVMWNILIDNLKKQNVNEYEKEIYQEIKDRYSLEENNINDIEELKSIYLKFCKKRIKFNSEDLKAEQLNIVDEIYNIWFSNKNNKHLMQINDILQNRNKSKSKIEEKVRKYFEDNERVVNEQDERKFLSYISDKERNLINVIGITTTARTQFTILDKIRDLFVDYPIDVVIIDEISKSSTPEILSRAILSKKVIFCGDYNQLPPTSDIDEIFVNKIFEDDNYEYAKKFKEIFDLSSDTSEEKQKREMIESFQKIYECSFFTNQIENLKKRENSHTKSYEFLTEQHRFSENIMNIVNINYPGEELKMGQSNDRFEKNRYDLKINDTSYRSTDVILIDTTKFNDSYISKLESKKINIVNDYAFDQKEIIFNKNIKTKSVGTFNEYNASVCEQICESLINSNQDKDMKNKIGVICLTRNQKNIIRENFKNNPVLKSQMIKIDTIDNFQGREKDIIIVDFVRAKKEYKNGRISPEDKNRNLDFISDKKRNNVALSRPRNKLILVGAFDYYQEQIKSNISWLASQYFKHANKTIYWKDE